MKTHLKALLGLGIAVAVIVPAGAAYAATSPGNGPGSGMTTSHNMDAADCHKQHAGRHAQMPDHGANMGAMHSLMHNKMQDGSPANSGPDRDLISTMIVVRSHRVLVVDDEDKIRDIVRRYLSKTATRSPTPQTVRAPCSSRASCSLTSSCATS